MRSPLSITTVNPLQRVWRSITSLAQTTIQGQQRSRVRQFNNDFTYLGRQYDLEITEYPVRDTVKARQLIEMYEYCGEIATAINEITDSVWSSDDGDDQGFAIAPTLNDNTTKIDPQVEKILRRLIDEVIGGITLEPCVERILMYGDAFASIGVDLKKMRVEKLLFLPTWEMFRVESNQGHLYGFEQRKYLSDGDAIQFHPISLVHWRYRRKTLYGRSLFYESDGDWQNLKAATEDMAAATRAVGINPNIHKMPEGCDESYRKSYKAAYEAKRGQGVVTDFYLMNSASVEKLANINPDLTALVEAVLLWRRRIAMRSRVPVYLLGLETPGAKDIAGQPALAYARFINRVRASVTQGIKQICNLELALAGIPKERWQYRIIWPKIYTNPYSQDLNSESNLSGIEDSDV